jgi:hypothetical protein
MGSAVRIETLKRASAMVGGPLPLRRYLKVSAAALALWMSGAVATPTDVFLKAVDLLYDQDITNLRNR